ncbi:hypothetical protein GGF41_006745, partial [Coemansia sp. RSA 2531]
MVFTKPVRKKRNFKSLTLAVSENATPAAPGGGGAATATGSSAAPLASASHHSVPLSLGNGVS